MKENILSKALLFCFLAAVVSCKAKRNVVAMQPKADSTALSRVNAAVSKLEQIRSAQLNFVTFSGKAHAKLSMKGTTNDVTLTIRISNSKKIWISVTAIAGIEVARAMITPDSVFVMNRLDGVYLKKPFSYIYRYADSQVNYKTLESLLIGNAIPDLLRDKDQLKPDNGNINLSGNINDLSYAMVFGPNLRENSANLSNQSASQSLQVSNSIFIPAGNKMVPSQIDIASQAKDQKVQINLRYFKVDFDLPQDYPFTIPDRYTPID